MQRPGTQRRETTVSCEDLSGQVGGVEVREASERSTGDREGSVTTGGTGQRLGGGTVVRQAETRGVCGVRVRHSVEEEGPTRECPGPESRPWRREEVSCR